MMERNGFSRRLSGWARGSSIYAAFCAAIFGAALMSAPLAHAGDPAATKLERETVLSIDLKSLIAGSYYIPRHNFSGSYLSAKFAQNRQDWDKAAFYMEDALVLSPDGHKLKDSAFVMLLGNGQIDAAMAVGRDYKLGEDLEPLNLLLHTIRDIRKNDPARALERLSSQEMTGLHLYAQSVTKAWIYAHQKNKDAALGALENIPAYDDGDKSVIYHLFAASILDYMGDVQGAGYHYQRVLETSAPLQSTYYIQDFFKRTNNTKVTELLEDAIANAELEIDFSKKRTPLASKALPELVAYSLFDLTSFLFEQKGYESALIYTRIAEFSDPNLQEVHMMLGDLMGNYGRYDAALEHFKRVTPDHHEYRAAQLRLAEAYEKTGFHVKAQAILEDIAATQRAHKSDALIRLGDLHRRNGDFAKAVEYYDQAIAHSDTNADWALYYARAVSLDNAEQWERAEADLLKALDMNPDHPLLLNYLGYSWVDRGLKLEEGMDMIERALAKRPYDGYIMDSAGWALHKLGRHEEAVQILEVAIQLVPDDTVIHEHLGDAYWAVGRKIEARFAWDKALRMNEDESRVYAIRAKIKHGLVSDPVEIVSAGKTAATAEKPAKTTETKP